jgi:hypothetical protein
MASPRRRPCRPGWTSAGLGPLAHQTQTSGRSWIPGERIRSGPSMPGDTSRGLGRANSMTHVVVPEFIPQHVSELPAGTTTPRRRGRIAPASQD